MIKSINDEDMNYIYNKKHLNYDPFSNDKLWSCKNYRGLYFHINISQKFLKSW